MLKRTIVTITVLLAASGCATGHKNKTAPVAAPFTNNSPAWCLVLPELRARTDQAVEFTSDPTRRGDGVQYMISALAAYASDPNMDLLIVNAQELYADRDSVFFEPRYQSLGEIEDGMQSRYCH